jgi:hypothetical protein
MEEKIRFLAGNISKKREKSLCTPELARMVNPPKTSFKS